MALCRGVLSIPLGLLATGPRHPAEEWQEHPGGMLSPMALSLHLWTGTSSLHPRHTSSLHPGHTSSLHPGHILSPHHRPLAPKPPSFSPKPAPIPPGASGSQCGGSRTALLWTGCAAEWSIPSARDRDEGAAEPPGAQTTPLRAEPPPPPMAPSLCWGLSALPHQPWGAPSPALQPPGAMGRAFSTINKVSFLSPLPWSISPGGSIGREAAGQGAAGSRGSPLSPGCPGRWGGS